MCKRSPFLLAFLALALLALPAATAAITIPKGFKAPKVTSYPIAIDAVGYLEYTWTYDTTEACRPGYAKSLEEVLTFELGRPRAAKLSVVNGNTIVTPVLAGDATVQTELSNWRTTNYCPPDTPLPEPPEPICKTKLKGKMGIALAPVKEEGEDLTPLVRPVQVAVFRAKATPQLPSCTKDRPDIRSEGERSKGWHADPISGIIAPLGATDTQFVKLGVGRTLKRTVKVSGGCGMASFSAISPNIRSCVVKGKLVVTIRRTGAGFSAG